MADEKQETPWPIPQFHFKVSFGDKGEIAFQEVSGLDTEYDIVDYRAAHHVNFDVVKMPGIKKAADITLKKGMFSNDRALYDLLNSVKMNDVTRQTITIQLLDEENKPLYTWTLKNACPKKVSGINLNVRTSEAALEELVIVHEGLTMSK